MQIISRKEAKTQELKRYYTGKPCKHGHLSERHVSSGSCLECANIYYVGNKKKIDKRKHKWYENNKVQHAYSGTIWRQIHREEVNAKSKEWWKNNKEKHNETAKKWRTNNPEIVARNKRTYLKRKKQAIPQWYETELVKQIYLMRDKLSMLWGIQLHVDHIVPLQSENVCGLHCWDNLQLLEATLNISKSNK